MNLADAIRQAALRSHPEVEAQADAEQAEYSAEAQAYLAEQPEYSGPEPSPAPAPAQAYDAVTAQPVYMPEPPAGAVLGGNVVRLELFLAPEQLNSLFRAVVATQHSVMTLREAASYLRVHPSTLEGMAVEGKVPAFTIEGRWRFPKHGIDEWLALQAFQKENGNVA
jgi:excisionase family DNA binding protein